MGGRGSGSFPDDGSTHRGGRSKKAAVVVTGNGVPVCPSDLSESVKQYWWQVADQVQGVAFEQDSDAITEMAWLMYRQNEYRQGFLANPTDEVANRTSLAIGRAIKDLWVQFGMTPRSRQVLLVPREDDEQDDLEQLMAEREGG